METITIWGFKIASFNVQNKEVHATITHEHTKFIPSFAFENSNGGKNIISELKKSFRNLSEVDLLDPNNRDPEVIMKIVPSSSFAGSYDKLVIIIRKSNKYWT